MRVRAGATVADDGARGAAAALLRDASGQTLAEFALVLAFFSIVAISGYRLVIVNINAQQAHEQSGFAHDVDYPVQQFTPLPSSMSS